MRKEKDLSNSLAELLTICGVTEIPYMSRSATELILPLAWTAVGGNPLPPNQRVERQVFKGWELNMNTSRVKARGAKNMILRIIIFAQTHSRAEEGDIRDCQNSKNNKSLIRTAAASPPTPTPTPPPRCHQQSKTARALIARKGSKNSSRCLEWKG